MSKESPVIISDSEEEGASSSAPVVLVEDPSSPVKLVVSPAFR